MISLKTYLIIWINSEGAEPITVIQKLHEIGFKSITGRYDLEYDWKRIVSIEDIWRLGTTVHETLRGLNVLYKMETI